MGQLMTWLKLLFKNFIAMYSEPDPIHDLGDYRKVKKWVKKVRKLFWGFSIVAAIEIILALALANAFDRPLVIAAAVVLFPPMLLLTNWGYATMILYLPQIFKSVLKSGRSGYRVGEQVETTHVRVTHEYGNQYRVSSHTENQGCLFAYIAGIAKFCVWAFFCVYIGPFVTFKKLRSSLRNLAEYRPE